MKEKIINLYTLFYSKFYNKEFKFPERKYKVIDAFLKDMIKEYGSEENIGEFFIFQFLAFQFNYWYKLETKKKIEPEWILRGEALTRWNIRESNESWWYWCEQFVNELEIPYPSNQYKRNLHELSDYEELEKKRFYGNKGGFENCIESTTLYNKKSLSCRLCNYKEECKDLLKENYPNIYRRRI